jgi:hypothetical protein
MTAIRLFSPGCEAGAFSSDRYVRFASMSRMSSCRVRHKALPIALRGTPWPEAAGTLALERRA